MSPPHQHPCDWCGHAGTCRLADHLVAQRLLGNVVPRQPGPQCPTYPAVTAQEVGDNGRGLGAGAERGSQGRAGQEGVGKLRAETLILWLSLLDTPLACG